jgi:Cu(I)/Ag(I) efflux system membrane fusion protein
MKHDALLRVTLVVLFGALLAAACKRASIEHGTGEHAAMSAAPMSSGLPEHAGHDMAGMGASGHASAIPSGYAPVPLNPEATERLDLTTAVVDERDFTKTLRTVGVVSVDETRSSHVHPKVRGWLDEVFVNFTGKPVKAGSPLCTIYSPEILSAELELLALLDQTAPAPSTPKNDFSDIERSARRVTVDAARRRLSLWDVPESEVERLEKTHEPKKSFTLVAPRSGTVVAKQAIAGMYVDASTELYLLSDLSRVWVLIDLYEADVPFVKVGDTAHLVIEGLGSDPVDSKIAFLYPTIDESTRTLKARFELDNRDRRLRPGAFVTAQMEVAMGRGLAVPESAVLKTGTRNVVFVVETDRAVPRDVQVGPSVGGWYRVASGLSRGDRVATGAQFLLDSESRIRATSQPGGVHAH